MKRLKQPKKWNSKYFLITVLIVILVTALLVVFDSNAASAFSDIVVLGLPIVYILFYIGNSCTDNATTKKKIKGRNESKHEKYYSFIAPATVVCCFIGLIYKMVFWDTLMGSTST